MDELSNSWPIVVGRPLGSSGSAAFWGAPALACTAPRHPADHGWGRLSHTAAIGRRGR